MSSLSAHLVDSYDHQRALHRHRLSNPITHNGRQPFTPQYIITEDNTPGEPVFNPPSSEAFGVLHGRPVRGWTGSLETISKVDQEELGRAGSLMVAQRGSLDMSHSMSSHGHPSNRHDNPSTSSSHTYTTTNIQMKQEPPSTPLHSIPPSSLSNPPTTSTNPTSFPPHPYPPTPTMGISEYTASQISTLQSRLAKKLGPEYINHRPGPGGGPQLSYIEGWKVITLANEVFGFNGWSSQIISLATDFCDETSPGRYSVGVSAIIRVTLRDGTFHEDTGFGGGDNLKGKGSSLDKAKKEAVTDGIKRTLRTFGNVLGMCLYDKRFLTDIKKVKVPPAPPLRPEELWRRPEFDPALQASAEAGPSTRPHPMLDVDAQRARAAETRRREADGLVQHGGSGGVVRDEQGFVKPALPTRLQTMNGGGMSTTTASDPPAQQQLNNKRPTIPPKDPAARAAGAQARAEAFAAAAGAAIIRPTTAQVEESYADDDDLFANISMDDVMADDPSMGMTSSDILTAVEAGTGLDDMTLVEDERATADGFGLPPPPQAASSTIVKKESDAVPPTIRTNSAGTFVYPAQPGATGPSYAPNGAKKLSPVEAAAKQARAQAIMTGINGDLSGASTDEAFGATRGMKRGNPSDGDGFGYAKPGKYGEITSGRKVLGDLTVSEMAHPPIAKRIRS